MEITEHMKHVLLYCFERKLNGQHAFEKISRTFGDGAISRSTVFKWFARFEKGDSSLASKPHSGRPVEVDEQALLAAVEEDSKLSTRDLGERFGIDHTTAMRRLKKLGMV
jgi:transposase